MKPVSGSRFRWRNAVAGSVVAWILAFPPGTAASPESRALVRQGAAELANRKFEEALRKFDAAVRADPADAQAVFFRGAALNRLSRHAEALPRLQEAARLGSNHPDLPFELGWALLGLGHWHAAILHLERYEQSRPGRGQTSEFLGRAFLALGDVDRAEAKLKEAITRDPALRATALLFLARLEQARGNADEAARLLDTLLREAPESPLARTLREQLARLAPPPPPGRPWRLSVSTGGGHNSNVIALGDGIQRPADISSQWSAFARFALNAAYDWRPSPTDTVTAGYAFLADVYSRVHSFDLQDHAVAVDWRRAFTPDLAATVRLGDQFTLVGDNAYRNQATLRPALAYRLTGWAVAEAAYSLAVSDYYFATPSVQDRDGTSHTVALTTDLVAPGTRLRTRLGYFHVWNRADGDDFVFQTNGLLAGVSYPLGRGITGDVTYTRTFDRYANANSLAGPTGSAFSRKDDVDILSIQLTGPVVFDRLRAYARYDYTNAGSNIQFYTFKQRVVSFGLVASF